MATHTTKKKPNKLAGNGGVGALQALTPQKQLNQHQHCNDLALYSRFDLISQTLSYVVDHAILQLKTLPCYRKKR